LPNLNILPLKREKWDNTTKYFNSIDTRAKQTNAWTSDKSFNKSMHAYTKQVEESEERKEQRRQALKQRQDSLKLLIQSERKSFEDELKSIRINGKENANTVYSLKLRAENLKSAREEDRKKVAEAKLYESWRQNNPEIRELEARKFQDHVKEKWSSQINEKREASAALQHEQDEYVKYLELEKQKAADLDVELKRLKLNREIELKEILKQQMIELRQREAETDILNREEAELMKENLEMSRLSEERRRALDENSRQEYGRQLLRQHKAKLRRKAKEVQDALELDLKLLKVISETQDKKRHLESARRQKARADAEQMMQILGQQLRLEKQREAELENMFQDEAAKEWDKRNEEWKRESEAREALMRQVLEERQQQIEEKFNILSEKKRDSLLKREELIRDMEKTQMLAKKEREKSEAAKMERKKELESQITSRKDEMFQNEILNEVDNYEQEQIKNEAYKSFLDQEKKKTTETKFEQKVLFVLRNIICKMGTDRKGRLV
jgi:trichoplein keratin filament-binding protein